jgi:hypothetical protein
MQPCASIDTAGMQFLLSRSDATAARGVAADQLNAGCLSLEGGDPATA